MPGRTGWGLGLWTLAATLSVVASMPKDDHFRSVLRPAHWGGLELPGKPASTKQRRVHGAVHPHVIQMPRSAPGQKTFRVYLEMSPTQAKSIYALFGDDYSTMELAVDEPNKQLYQVEPPFGADIAGVDDKLFALNNAAEFDTWLTVGADNGNVDSAISALGLGTFSSYLKVNDGAVFAMNPDKVPLSKSSVPAELRGRKALLVAQVTIPEDSTFSGHLNAQGRSVGDRKDWQEYGVCFSTGDYCEYHKLPDEL